jgi:hypothetical protein
MKARGPQNPLALLARLPVAAIALALLRNTLRFSPTVGGEWPAYVVLRFRKASLLSTDVPFIALVGLDEGAGHMGALILARRRKVAAWFKK